MKNTFDFTSSGTAGVDANGMINCTGIVSTGVVSAPSFSGAVSGTTGTFSGAVSGTTGTFSGAVSGTTGTFSGAIGVNGVTAPTQAALPTTLAQVITILTNLGFCASS